MSNRKRKISDSGIYFECTRCGQCCTIADGWVEMDTNEKTQAARFLNLSIRDFEKRFISDIGVDINIVKNKKDNRCIFLNDELSCDIYPARPDHCRHFPFRPENMKSEYRWQLTKNICPGIGSGRFYSKEEITEILKKQKK